MFIFCFEALENLGPCYENSELCVVFDFFSFNIRMIEKALRFLALVLDIETFILEFYDE